MEKKKIGPEKKQKKKALFLRESGCSSESRDVAALLWWEGVHAAVACVPSVDDAFLKGGSGGESPGALGERVTCLAAGVLGGLGPVAAPLQQQRVQQGL